MEGFMYQALRNKIKHRVQGIKSQKLRDIVILFMQYTIQWKILLKIFS